MTTASSSPAGQPLRQLQWPALPPVDLVEECRWLVSLDARNADPARELRQINGGQNLGLLNNRIATKELQGLSKQSSPYRQALRRPKPPAPSPGSPAQRAAKSILKLKEGLLRLDGSKWNSTELQADSATIAACQLQQEPVNRPNTRSPSKPIEPSLKATTARTSSARSPSPDRVRSLSKRRKKRPPTREERELTEKQTQLAVWLKANPDARPANELVDSRGGDATRYSVEVASRIESAMQCRGPLEAGVRLWDDPVRSLLAAEMTSESVFGGAVPTRALAYQPPQSSSPPHAVHVNPTQKSPVQQPEAVVASVREEPLLNALEQATIDTEDSIAPAATKFDMSELAQNVFGTAHRQVADGAVADALATLEAGIRQSLSTSQAHLDAVSGAHGVGFNYSALAHTSATKLQLYYRARHARRVNRLVLLQRQWRWWQTRKRAWNALHYANKQAAVIQRRYISWHTRLTRLRGAVRIQRCFRVFSSQKFLVRFRQVCRLLLARQARRRQVKTRMRIIGKTVLWLRKRRRQIALVQGLWRRRRAQAQLATLLTHVSAVELERRTREDAFVAQKLTQTSACFRDFLTSTKPGRRLVRSQAEKPWLRFRRLRHDRRQWSELLLSDKIASVAGVLPNRRFQGLQLRALCQMLVGADKQLPALPKELKVTPQALGFLAIPPDIDAPPPAQAAVCCPWWAAVRGSVKRTRRKLARRAATLWWTIAVYPKEYCAARIWPIRGRRRVEARQQLEDDFARGIAAFLRVWFRRMDVKANTPPFACEWCSAPFGTAREYFAHGKCIDARALAEAEWTALCSDLALARRKRWRLSRQPRENPVRPAVHEFDLDAASVRRLRRTRSRRKALRPLVAMLDICAAGERVNAVIPLGLAGFVLQYVDDERASHPLMQTAEHQLVQWSPLVGSMGVESARLGSEGPRWIGKDELRSRLLAGSKWRGVCTRLRRSIGRRSAKYRPLRVLHTRTGNAGALTMKAPRAAGYWNQVASKWNELQVRVRRAVQGRRQGVPASTSLSAAGTRVLPVET